MNRLHLVGALNFVTGNDGEFSEPVQRAISAHCLLNRTSYADVAHIASRFVTGLGKSADSFEARTWFGLIGGPRSAVRRLALVKGGARV